jgi:NADH-quinone oxidoreductase subunit H
MTEPIASFAGSTIGTLGQANPSIINDISDNFWLVLVMKAAVVLVFFLVVPLAIGYMEHKVLAHMQARVGPMEAGAFHGWAQLVADGVKFIQKEDIVPAAADGKVFSLAPAVAMIPYIAILVVLPFSESAFAISLDVGIFFVMAMSSVSVIGVLMAGWSSANKFSLIGALRAAAQLIAYELPLVLAAAAAVMLAGQTSMIGIVEAQQDLWYVVPLFPLFIIFMIAALAELTRPPFDMPVADSEIIFGAYTEYTGLKFAFFLLAEYGGIVALSGVAAVLFLGGYQGLPGIPLPPPVWMFAKIGALSFIVIWLRATYPRLREDQLQRFAWLALIPFSLFWILGVAVVKVAVK